MSTTPDPAGSTAATAPDEAEAVEATTTAEAVEPEAVEPEAVEPETAAGTETTDATESDTAVSDQSSEADEAQTPPPTAPTPSSSTSASGQADTASDDESDDESDDDSDEDRQKSAVEFAAEHDPANHDVTAGEEFRHPGDWTADEAGGPQVFDDEGNLVAEGGQATGEGADTDSDDGAGGPSAGGRRVSDLDEVRDGGYSVGSAATLHDGAMPMGHPVKAWEDTKTFVTEDHDHYDEAEPDLWFTDADAAQRAGFRPAD